MAGNALGQLIDADWGNAEVLIVDLPPGTGDVQLTMLQRHKPAGAVIVSTPQDLALIDAKRAIQLFEVGQVPVIGMVENMAGYACPHCGEVSDPFGSGGAEAAAGELGMPFLGRIPLQLAVREASDAGTPPAAGDGPAGGVPLRRLPNVWQPGSTTSDLRAAPGLRWRGRAGAAHETIAARSADRGRGGGGLIAAWALSPRSFAPPLQAGEGEVAFDAWLKIGKDGVVSVAVPDLEMGSGDHHPDPADRRL